MTMMTVMMMMMMMMMLICFADSDILSGDWAAVESNIVASAANVTAAICARAQASRYHGLSLLIWRSRFWDWPCIVFGTQWTLFNWFYCWSCGKFNTHTHTHTHTNTYRYTRKREKKKYIRLIYVLSEEKNLFLTSHNGNNDSSSSSSTNGNCSNSNSCKIRMASTEGRQWYST